MQKQTQSTTFEHLRLKAVLTMSKTHYVQKVVEYQTVIDDAFREVNSSMKIFFPKLKLDYPKPCVMFYVKNGGGRCLIRAATPIQLADKLEQLCVILRSDLWLDIWLHLDGIGHDIVANDFMDDKKFVDLG